MNRQRTQVVELPVSKILPNPNQPRKHFDRLKMIELARSVKRNGVIHPVTVRPHEGAFQLISGERRVRASVMAGKRTVPAVILDTDERSSAIFALLENLQREDLSFFEIAEGYKNLLGKKELSRAELAYQLGKNVSSVAGKMRLLRLGGRVKKLVRDLKLSERHANAVLAIDDEEKQIESIRKMHEKNMSAAQAEEYIENLGDDKTQHRTVPDLGISLRRAVNSAKKNGIFANIKETEFDDEIEYVISVKK